MGVRLTRKEVAEIIETFVDGTGGQWDWDDFISVSIKDSELEKIRVRCARLPEEFPSKKKDEYCNEHGIDVLRAYIKQLRLRGKT